MPRRQQSGPGYSKKTAKEIGCENLTKPNIEIAIQNALAARSKRTEITAEMVLAELARVGFSNMAHYAKWNPDGVTLVDSDNLTEDAARLRSGRYPRPLQRKAGP